MNIIRNAEVNGRLVDIAFDDKIRQISFKYLDGDFENIYDLEGKLLIPGGIDPHVHFNQPGFAQREDFATGSASAIAGGVTTVIDMPCTSLPPITSVDNYENKYNVIKNTSYVDFAFWGGITGDGYDKKTVEKLWEHGVVGFKLYTISGMDTYKATPYNLLKQIFGDFGGSDKLFAFHAEDARTIANATSEFTPEQLTKWENYVPSRPSEAEITAVKRVIKSMQSNKIHFVHISTKGAAKSILEAKKSGKDISFETCPHYLQFTKEDYEHLLGRLKTAPSVKDEADKSFLRDNLGKIDFLATDHAGCIWETEKDLQDFSKVYCGIPGVQTFLQYVVDEFYLSGKTSYGELVRLTSEGAAKRYGLYPRKGALEIGADADFAVFDTNKSHLMKKEDLLCKGKYSPFEGRKFGCSLAQTFLRGKLIYDGFLLEDRVHGQLLKREK